MEKEEIQSELQWTTFSYKDLDIEILVFFIGFYYFCLWCFRYGKMYYRNYFGTRCTTERYGKDSWAIVTGGTDGLGLAAVGQLAELGFNIINISNSQDQMKKVQEEVNKKGPKV